MIGLPVNASMLKVLSSPSLRLYVTLLFGSLTSPSFALTFVITEPIGADSDTLAWYKSRSNVGDLSLESITLMITLREDRLKGNKPIIIRDQVGTGKGDKYSQGWVRETESQTSVRGGGAEVA